MRRKTNLFYTSGPNSKFLTFSNYTESLTGNFLSTDTKIYPSIFLCLNIPSLNILENRENFIKNYLVGYYENKLALLRDYCIKENKKPEDKIKPLNYLLEAIYKYCEDVNESTSNIITYVGDITEQDYNGTYTDTICLIDFTSKLSFNSIDRNDISNLDVREYIDIDNEVLDTNILYGWENDHIIDGYKDVPPIYDEENNNVKRYNYDSYIKKLDFKEVFDGLTQIEFNVVIPLFDVTNINYHTKSYLYDNFENIKLSEEDTNEENIYYISLEGNDKDDLYRKNVPLGIWFSDDSILLKKDINTGFSQNWSLLISSQFKPFPYSNIKDYQDDTSNSNAYPTFAMVLSKQNEILDEFRKISKINQELSEKINSLQSQINNKATESNIDKIKKDFIQFEYEMVSKYNSMKQEMKEFMENLVWKATE